MRTPERVKVGGSHKLAVGGPRSEGTNNNGCPKYAHAVKNTGIICRVSRLMSAIEF